MNELESDVWLSQKGENKGTFVALRMLQTIVNNEMHGSFPNNYVHLLTHLPLLVKNCSGERSLSALNVLKSASGPLYGSFPNNYVHLLTHLPLLVKNCSGERSLSALNVLKSASGPL